MVLLLSLAAMLIMQSIARAEVKTSDHDKPAPPAPEKSTTGTQTGKTSRWKSIVNDSMAQTKLLVEEKKLTETLEYIEAQRAIYSADPDYKNDPDLLLRLTWIEADVAQDLGSHYAANKDWLQAEDYFEKAVKLYLSLSGTVAATYNNFRQTAGDCKHPNDGGAVQNLLWVAIHNAGKHLDEAEAFMGRYKNCAARSRQQSWENDVRGFVLRDNNEKMPLLR